MQTEAEFEAQELRNVEIVKNGILKGYNNEIIADLTGLSIEKIEKLRNETKN